MSTHSTGAAFLSGTLRDAYVCKSPGGLLGLNEQQQHRARCTHPLFTSVKHPKVRCFSRKLQGILWRATASHLAGHIHNPEWSGPDRKPDHLSALCATAADSANRTPPPTRLSSFSKFTLIKVSAGRELTDELIQDLHFRDEKTEAQKGKHIPSS